ncbi:unnamed protein product [Closterium sp. NIES-54]
MYALTASVEGDCYLCVPPDPDTEAASLGASESSLPGTWSAEALHTFTLDLGASRCFFRDSTTLTPLLAPIPVRLADPSGGPVLAHSTTVLPCPAVPFGSLSGLHLPSFSTNLVSIAALQNAMVTTTTPGGQHVSICTCTWTGRQLAMFTRRPGSSLYTLNTEPPHVAASAQVSASGPVAAPCSSLPPLLPSPAPPCLPCVEGRQRAVPHSSFPPMTAPLQTLHMDVWGPARVSEQDRERYFLLVVDDYTRYTAVFPLRSKGEVLDVLIPWIRAVRPQLRERFHEDLPVLRLHSYRGGEFSSDLLRDFCRGDASSSLMEVARTSMIHAAAPHFLWPFVVRYAAHQLNLWPRVSLPETSPTLRWTGKVGDESVFQVWGSRAFVRDTSADKLSSRAIPCGPAPSGVSQLDPLPLAKPVEVTIESGAAGGGAARGAASRGVEPAGAEPWGAEPASAEPGGAEPEGAEPGGAETEGAEPGGAQSEGAESGGAEHRGTASTGRARGPAAGGTEAEGAGHASPGGAGVSARARGTGAAGAAGPGGARTRGTGAAGTGGVRGASAGDPGAGGTGAEGAGAGGTGAESPTTGGIGVGDPGAGGAGAGGAGARGTGDGDPGAGGKQAGDPGAGGAGDGDPGIASPGGARDTTGTGGAGARGTGGAGAAGPGGSCTKGTGAAGAGGVGGAGAGDPGAGGTRARDPRARGVGAGGAGARGIGAGDPGVGGAGAGDHGAGGACAGGAGVGGNGAGGTVQRRSFFRSAATVVSTATWLSPLPVAELVDLAAACRLDYAASLVAGSKSDCPPSVGGASALLTDVLEDTQDDFECLEAAVPHLVAMLLAPEGDSDAPDIPTPRSYAEAIMGPYSS